MSKIENPTCDICGDDTVIKFIPSFGMDIVPTGLKATCIRCGRERFIKSLKDENLAQK